MKENAVPFALKCGNCDEMTVLQCELQDIEPGYRGDIYITLHAQWPSGWHVVDFTGEVLCDKCYAEEMMKEREEDAAQ